MSWILPEEQIEQILDLGLAQIDAVRSDPYALPALLARIYGNLPEARAEKVEAWWRRHSVEITHSYPHAQATYPCWAILLRGGQNSVQYLGDTGIEVVLPSGATVIESAERWENDYGVVTYADNVDLLRWLHHAAKFFLSQSRRPLSLTFPYRQQLTEQDLEPVQLGGPTGRLIWRRVIGVHLEFDQTDATEDYVSNITSETHDASASSPFEQ